MNLRTLFNADILDLLMLGKAYFSDFEHVKSLPGGELENLGHIWFSCENKKDIKRLSSALCLGIDSTTPCRKGYQDAILFAKEYGFTIRITRFDLEEDFYRRMHGIMVAPIGWGNLSDDLSFYIYPGEILLENHPMSDGFLDMPDSDSSDGSELSVQGFRTWDAKSRNMGVIVSDNVDTPFFIDTDCLKAEENLMIDNKQRYELYLKQGLNPGQAYARVTVENSVGTEYEWTALRHQDLRNAFFDAWPDAHKKGMAVDKEKMKTFLEMCKSKVTKPRYVQKHFWTQYRNENGINVWRKHVSPAEKEQLHPSWKKPTNYILGS